ncbi:PhzF family phenazine biosynthesis protein [Natranaeroarchaeum aerophilus]|uniref:PhzF family phenazine biosynthesis protein n=1 Tax=Natranaeroarchaeum aerophilus TaxID=2917711 RepID=A0AAE3K6E8_9EURY|nr:PhzF family phenazine biosynthesis protein [Natranaeroarchaeum aerophilus]MCL9814330.1 PhzF family phenazine biosynthesis protein [Natranaeroarchaeum aerophilus]
MNDEETIEVSLVDAFTEEPLTGNAAGVVTEADDLADEQMQAIARELSVSETAFVSESDEADRAIRYFTPQEEVDLCGHATVAMHAHLTETGAIEPGTHTLATNVGSIEIEVTDDGVVWMGGDSPTVRPVEIEYGRLADALGIDEIALSEPGVELSPAVASTGEPFLMVPVTYLQALLNAEPDDAAIDELCAAVDATGIYAFTFDALDPDSTLHARAFASPVGISEDPVTGTASAAAGAYLREMNAFGGELPEEMLFEQGHVLDRPGTVRVRVGDGIRVGGHAVTSLEGELAVPPAEDDEIVEV